MNASPSVPGPSAMRASWQSHDCRNERRTKVTLLKNACGASRSHLTRDLVECECGAMQEVAVIDNAVGAPVALEPTRARVLAELVKPGSATTLAERLGLPRQKLNYHVRALEAQ